MRAGRILIDTGAIFASVVRNDVNHEAARKFIARVLRSRSVFVLSDVVFGETMTLVKSRVGAETALAVGRELRRNPLYGWVALGTDGERDTWATFQKYDDKDWSYFDCAVLVLARRLHIDSVFAFDGHFDQMPEITRVP